MGVNDIIRVGNNIKKIRKEQKLSQKDMAKILNLPCSTYSNYENNNREPSAKILKKIADVLNVDIKDILTLNLKNKTNGYDRYLSDDVNKIEPMEHLIKLCQFQIKFNEFMDSNTDIKESLKIAIKNNTIPLTYISNGEDNLDLTNDEFMKLTDKILKFIKFELNSLMSQKSV